MQPHGAVLRLECDSPRLCRRMTRRDASWRCSACDGWPVRPPPSARAPRRSASAASAPRRSRFLRSRAVAQLGSIRGSTSCLCSGQWAARLRLCVCVCHVRCARTHRPSGRCACVPLCHISPRARRPDYSTTRINPTGRINPPDTGLIHHPRINPTPRINPPNPHTPDRGGLIHLRRLD